MQLRNTTYDKKDLSRFSNWYTQLTQWASHCFRKQDYRNIFINCERFLIDWRHQIRISSASFGKSIWYRLLRNWVTYRDHLSLDILDGWHLWTTPWYKRIRFRYRQPEIGSKDCQLWKVGRNWVKIETCKPLNSSYDQLLSV